MKVGIGFTAGAFVGGRYFADILLDQAPVILEADGHWHVIHKERDIKRDAHLKVCGYKVFRFTGAQLNHGADQCVQSVVDECSLAPDADPQYVIRVSMMLGNENPNWGGGPQAVTCTQCGSETSRSNFRTSVKKPFCNSQCYGAWMSDHPEESCRRKNIDWDEVAAMYRSGASPDEIMLKYGIAKTTLYRKLREMPDVGSPALSEASVQVRRGGASQLPPWMGEAPRERQGPRPGRDERQVPQAG